MKIYNVLVLLVLSSWVAKSQIMAFPPDAIILCDINNPGDETEVFDLTIREAQILNGQTSANITYHETSGDALSGTNAFSNPTAYSNIYNPQNVFVRLQSTNGQGWDVTTLELIVPLIPVVAQIPDDIFIDEGDGNAIAEFDLTINEAQALGAQDPFLFQIKYYESFNDANNNLNAIATPEAYTNLSNPQIIYARLAPNQDECDFEVYDFSISTDGVLGIGSLNGEQFNLYPNPASESITIESLFLASESTVTIFNMLGQEVFSEIMTPENGTLVFSVSEINSGLYLLTLSSEGNAVTKKLLIK